MASDLLDAILANDAAAVNNALANGADPNSRVFLSSGKNSPVILAAAAEKNLEIIESLIQAGADVTAKSDTGNTALHEATRANRIGTVVPRLIEAGADVNARNAQGATPLMIASSGSDRKAVESLIKAGADVNAQDNKGRTAAHWLVYEQIQGQPGGRRVDPAGTMKELVKSGADLNAKDKEGKNIYDYLDELAKVGPADARIAQGIRQAISQAQAEKAAAGLGKVGLTESSPAGTMMDSLKKDGGAQPAQVGGKDSPSAAVPVR